MHSSNLVFTFLIVIFMRGYRLKYWLLTPSRKLPSQNKCLLLFKYIYLLNICSLKMT